MRITKLVRWKSGGDRTSGYGIIRIDNLKQSPYTSSVEITNLVNYLIDKLSSAIPPGYILGDQYLNKYDNNNDLKKNIDNVIMPDEYEGKNTLTRTLAFASHDDVIDWVTNYNPKELEIVEIPDDYDIIVLDKHHQSELLYPSYEYIMVPHGCEIFHL